MDHPENFFIVRIRTQSLSYGKTIAIDQLSQAAGSKHPEVLFLILFSRPDEGRRPCLLPYPAFLFLIPFSGLRHAGPCHTELKMKRRAHKMSIKNRPFNPDLLIKITLPEESGDTVSYEYRHCDIEETIESEDGCLQHVVTITPLGFMAASLSESEVCGILKQLHFDGDYVRDEIRHPFSILVPNRPFTGKIVNYTQKLSGITLPSAG